eukprot:gene7587-15548_t
MLSIQFCTVLLAAPFVFAFNTLPNQRFGARSKLSMVIDKAWPGQLPPTGFFDPLGLSEGKSDKELRRWRESELKHGRICMLAAIGILTAEVWNPLFGGKIMGASIYHFQEIQNIYPPFWLFLLTSIGIIEFYSINRGWESPEEKTTSLAMLKDEYIPGDLGFDPLNLMPKTLDSFNEMRTKELQNGRLAMLATVAFIAQELVDKRSILDHFVHYGFRYAGYGG